MSKKIAPVGPKRSSAKQFYEDVVKQNCAEGMANAKPHYLGEMDGVHVLHATHPNHDNLIGAHHHMSDIHAFHRAHEDATSKGFRTLILHGSPPKELAQHFPAALPAPEKSLKAGQNYKQLKKSEQDPPKGFISPTGSFHEVPKGMTHHEFIHEHTKANHPLLHAKSPNHDPHKYADDTYSNAMNSGWMSVGIGADYSKTGTSHNFQAHQSTLAHRSSPAMAALRNYAKKHWGENFEGMIHTDEGRVKPARYETAHFIRHGTLKEHK